MFEIRPTLCIQPSSFVLGRNDVSFHHACPSRLLYSAHGLLRKSFHRPSSLPSNVFNVLLTKIAYLAHPMVEIIYFFIRSTTEFISLCSHGLAVHHSGNAKLNKQYLLCSVLTKFRLNYNSEARVGTSKQQSKTCIGCWSS